MSNVQKKRIGRLMALLWPVLVMIANTDWIRSLIIPPATELVYGTGYRRDMFIPVVAEGSISFLLNGMNNRLSLRPTKNGKGSIFSIRAEVITTKNKYKYAFGIA